MTVVVVATASTNAAARATVRSVGRVDPSSPVVVLAVDEGYEPVRDEEVRRPEDVVPGAELHRWAALLEEEQLVRLLGVRLAAELLAAGREVLVVAAGVVLLSSPARFTGRVEETGFVALPRATAPLGRGPEDSASSLVPRPRLVSDLIALGPVILPSLPSLVRLLESWEVGDAALDLFAMAVPVTVVRDDAVLVTRWNTPPSAGFDEDGTALRRDGRGVVALDLGGLDPARPWLFDVRSDDPPMLLLSEHPALAHRCATEAEERGRDVHPATRRFSTTASGIPLHRHLRLVLRRTASEGGSFPDLFADGSATALTAWLLDVLPTGHDAGVARYLAAAYDDRDDLRAAFPLVPGPDTPALVDWALASGVGEAAYDPDLMRAAASATARAHRAVPLRQQGQYPHGVNLVGYLAGELGVGESARLVEQALTAGGVRHSTVPVARNLQSRTSATFEASRDNEVFDVTLLCVNADQTPEIAAAVATLTAGSRRIGMWYWEVEAFPASYAPAFDHVDEVWTATDFVRDAIAAAAPVPVVTMPPPLPQRSPERPSLPEGLGIPLDRPYFLFAFDYLSTVERKNPWAVVDAFRTAFGPGEGPVLVLKTINADKRPADAERLRLLVADDPDVVLLEGYLSAAERDALAARCACYVSLHRSEGLGLTIAEAMAWGRPVIATAYSGDMQFMTEQNSFLVPWTSTPIPEGADPYPAGSPWAEPDVTAAAAHMRTVVDDPERARGVGRRAAEDIRTLHSPEVAGRRMAEHLAGLHGASRNLDQRLTSLRDVVARRGRALRGSLPFTR
ncbi:glycosyltransferase family 4 protein [Cellulosimicrobium sp. PMB13]|uniref:glycosyltransferase family 4 protein n=1 Tax=Cellulosimicrobium sp. PMB13 TaxID=3120158 RepID=UPI003F4B55CF